MTYRTSILFGATLCLSVVSLIASDIPKKPFHLNEKIEKEIGYAQAVRIGDTLYISGLGRSGGDAHSDS
jgi:enamine deaminase RidA (YjgF/YER057c/UK114 family)